MTYKVAFSFADGKTLFCNVQNNELLLDAALRSGITLPMDCREGVCATCQGRCESGQYTQDYVDDEALSASDLAQRKVLSCQTRVKSDAAFYFDFASSLCDNTGPSALQGKVSQIEQVSQGTAIVQVTLDEQASGLDYLPGQYARLQIPGTDLRRSYSFANAPGSNTLEFLIRLLPDGAMSNYVRDRCQVGDVIQFEAPLGTFYLRHVDRPLTLVAGGTGLSAFLGMLDQIAAKGGCGQPVHLYYGVRTAQDLCQLARIEAYSQQIPGFRFVPVVSEEQADWSGRRGYIVDHLNAAALAEVPTDIYVCGPPPMVESIKDWLHGHSLDASRLYFEKFADSSV
ncbi:anthranilate 1,2-dioxygenase electron transfer component AntC [Pseudomonas syringae]|uniref:Anthranilate dioxygenase reductase n=4 Tax=Pseudomonas syringae TaxID=317 RepID=A0A3M4K8S8_PSESF|nr:anthranilate 1,2-dioxygenase electron transfer component AntC [Pseudomonas syringae]EPM47492.1 anthranilate dioxygenase reductase [Pseudomonas syringae pv. actinidiae ICMP 19098]EPN18493.1 anthranilate dioxygenase reductase [Pseudomonas syringae pv. actinidiae ICMP 19100]EPN25962.1 anthranilate dioxygenase reductase [Pseudomonas syringae pv. actinidiae ICMP 19099]EPN34016.1 anthranilate dioxygenase reductase [Pseudomonas syringae pv. actinidiae ICMP 18883]EPN42718.1 anthranilate dioxygenase